jgi:phosphatidylserine decarboxylase
MIASLSRRIRLAREAWAFILPLASITVLTASLGWRIPAGVGLVLIACVAFFFRDPERVIPQTPGAIVSPADGRVMEIVSEGEQTCRLSIFLSVLNVHVNRAPYDGKVRAVSYTPGKFLAAYRQEASIVNEANSITIEGQGREFVVKQIAGIPARRIVCRVQPGDMLAKGQRYGLIRFGSRTDVVMPRDAEVTVQVGDTVKGGESIIAFLKEPQGI